MTIFRIGVCLELVPKMAVNAIKGAHGFSIAKT